MADLECQLLATNSSQLCSCENYADEKPVTIDSRRGTIPKVQKYMRPLEYFKHRGKAAVRCMTPAQWRFVRAGKASLADGEREVRELPRLVTPGTIAIDVGAHIGDYTYALCSAVSPGGYVIAIEPLPDLARMLTRATSRLHLPVTVINCALSNSEGVAILNVPVAVGRRISGFATLEARAGRTQRCDVRLERLDSICRQLDSRVSFIKIDVEGHELAVLRGGEATLRRDRPNLLIEIEQRHSSVDINETFQFVRSLGYRGDFLDRDRVAHALEEFRKETHQVCRADGTPDDRYVSNFIFKPVG